MGGQGFGGPGMGPRWMGGQSFGRGGPDGRPPQTAGPDLPGPNAGPRWMGRPASFDMADRQPWAGPGYGPPHRWAAFGPMQQPPWQQNRPWGPPNPRWQQEYAYGAGPQQPWANGQDWYRRLLSYNLRPHHPWMADGARPNHPWRHYGSCGRPNRPWQASFEGPPRPWMAPWMQYGVGPQPPRQPHGQNWYQQLLSYNQRRAHPGLNLKALFDRLDTNHDDQLSFEEFSQGVRHLLHAILPGPGPGWGRPVGWYGGQGFGPPMRPAMGYYPVSRQEAFRERITRLFQNHGGKLTKEEAPPWIQKNFDRIDADKKGFATPRDLYRQFPFCGTGRKPRSQLRQVLKGLRKCHRLRKSRLNNANYIKCKPFSLIFARRTLTYLPGILYCALPTRPNLILF